MKKSEMLDKIQLLLERQSNDGISYRFKSLEILELIEKEGMKPPKYNKKEFNLYNYPICDIWLNKWELEDEKK